jgi:hypothetical protein
MEEETYTEKLAASDTQKQLPGHLLATVQPRSHELGVGNQLRCAQEMLSLSALSQLYRVSGHLSPYITWDYACNILVLRFAIK